LVVLLTVVACGGATHQKPRAEEDAPNAGRAGEKQAAAAGGRGSFGGRGSMAGDADSAGQPGDSASGGSTGAAGRNAAGVGGVLVPRAGAGGASGTTQDGEGGAGTEPPSSVKPWDPRVPPGVLPLDGEGGIAGVWYGAVELEAPGFWAPPIDHLTLALDESGLRSFAFQQFSRSGMVTDGMITAPALDNGRVFPVDESTLSATAFHLGYAGKVASEGVDYVEAVKGELRADELFVEYSISGALDSSSSIEGRASGLLHRVGAVRAPYAALPGIWYDEVSLSAPGFAGPPRDQLTLSFDAEGRPRHLRFEVFSVLPLSFGDSDSDFPLSGARWVRPRDTTWSYDAEVQQSSLTATSFELALDIRNHDDATPTTDVAVSITGALTELGLDVSYSMVGIVYGSPVDAHAEGLLQP
jgi:hypothetical protein